MTEKEARYNQVYMTIAKEFSSLSYAVRKKVGAIVVKNGNIISHGWNGMPSGFENECETQQTCFHCQGSGSKNIAHGMIDCPHCDGAGKILVTKPECLHAESNALMKLSKSNESSIGGELFVTLSPCRECSKLIIQSGIKKVHFEEEYRDDSGVKLLEKAGILVQKVKIEESK